MNFTMTDEIKKIKEGVLHLNEIEKQKRKI